MSRFKSKANRRNEGEKQCEEKRNNEMQTIFYLREKFSLNKSTVVRSKK